METIKKLLNLCPVPMVILNKEDQVLFINESFTYLAGYDLNDLSAVHCWFARAYPDDEQYRSEQKRVWEMASSRFQQEIDFSASGRLANVTCKNGSTRVFEIYGANLKENYNLIVFVDITEKEKRRKEKELLIHDLNQALLEVDTLRGILPLCSFCKKVRDDKGYWKQVDVYISEHSQAEISHSLCPECMKKYYPEEYEEIEKGKHSE